MKRLLSKLSSARAKLILWNTITFALVLVTLGAVFRVLAERSLVAALDREIRLQASRFRDAQQVRMVFVTQKAKTSLRPDGPKTLVVSASAEMLRAGIERKLANMQIGSPRARPDFKFIENIHVAMPDRSGQFLYRSFNLDGKPLAPQPPHLPFAIPGSDVGGPPTEKSEPNTYAPWDPAGFTRASHGKEHLADVESAGAELRILSLPLRESDKITGVVQIAAPLGQLQRDIAGLTRSLLLVLPPALLIAMIAGIFLTERALRPVKQLTRAAAGIRPDQLSRRLPVSGTDEFDELASTFNGALQRVESAFLDRERAIAQLRRFTADASHELRTPLTTIKTNTGVALENREPSEEHVHALSQIDRAADRMTALVQDLLLLARSDAGQLTLDLAAVSLPEVLQDAIDSLPRTPHASFELRCEVDDMTVCGDYEHLRRLFLNVLQNAARHTPPEGQIRVEISRKNGRPLVRIEDNGCGIPPEHLPNIGQPFYRADAGRNRKHGGAGLGLAICRSIAAAHDATLTVESELGEGTAVSVVFERVSG
jgi:signal transduction histidine kinase